MNKFGDANKTNILSLVTHMLEILLSNYLSI